MLEPVKWAQIESSPLADFEPDELVELALAVASGATGKTAVAAIFESRRKSAAGADHELPCA
jgi:hypothetical protein